MYTYNVSKSRRRPRGSHGARSQANGATGTYVAADVEKHAATRTHGAGDRTRDTGCMVTLDDNSAGPGKTLKARLAPACRDQGIVVFDPVGWQMVGGKLVLTARKGHTTELESHEDGSWMNDAKKGKTLSLKRI